MLILIIRYYLLNFIEVKYYIKIPGDETLLLKVSFLEYIISIKINGAQ